MLVEAVVIASDRAGTDVRRVPDARIADIGKMIGLRAVFDHGLLHLDKIADMNVTPDLRTWPQPRIGPDDRPLAINVPSTCVRI